MLYLALAVQVGRAQASGFCRDLASKPEDVVAQHLVVLELDALVRVMIKDMQEHKVVAGWERLTSQLWIQARHSLRPNPHIHARGHPVLSA